MELCLFDDTGRETARLPMRRGDDGTFSRHEPVGPGQRYGLRADGPYDPASGLWFDPDKLLMDPYAVQIDRPYVYDPRLAARRGEGGDTAALVPKAIVCALPAPIATPHRQFQPGGLIYEVNVRGFTKLHPDVPEAQRGTVAALGHPAVVDHLKRLGVSAVELMPVAAWIDERHLPPLGLTNAWGYNPVCFMALDPRLAPGGIAELRRATDTLREAGIGVILDVVFNHTGESDRHGPTLSLRGLDARAYFHHGPGGELANDTGTGNTLACDHPATRRLILYTLRYFVQQAGVDGFRFDLAPILGRTAEGFDSSAETLRAIEDDPVLADRVLIAEPWDIGPGGYQLGRFSERWLEWNDRYRDDTRRFWRGDGGTLGALASRLAGSSDVFGGNGASRTRNVNFIAAHDGMTLADLTAYVDRHNEANGEHNRDGHHDNLSWNHGAEGETDDETICARRGGDVAAMLATLFVARGTIMLTAGDEFGRTQGGNNNAYAQDNAVSWLDWRGRDSARETLVAALSRLRSELDLGDPTFLHPPQSGLLPAGLWLRPDWTPMMEADWHDPANRRVVLVIERPDRPAVAVLVNGDRRSAAFAPGHDKDRRWRRGLTTGPEEAPYNGHGTVDVAGRSVTVMIEEL